MAYDATNYTLLECCIRWILCELACLSKNSTPNDLDKSWTEFSIRIWHHHSVVLTILIEVYLNHMFDFMFI